MSAGMFRCAGCNGPIDGRKSRRYCSHACRIRYYNDQALYNAKGKRITATVGAVSELVVSADLLDRGLPVFRALSPAAPFDLVTLYDSQLFAIEVRTGYRTPKTGGVAHGKSHQGADLFAVYLRKEHTVLYFGITDKGIQFVSVHLNDPNRKWWLDAMPINRPQPLTPTSDRYEGVV